MSMEEARYGAVFPGNEASIPMIQSKFPLFRSKSVNLSVKLPVLEVVAPVPGTRKELPVPQTGFHYIWRSGGPLRVPIAIRSTRG
jgi:hypothetical protein